MYIVTYYDDDNFKHLIILNDFNEVNFIKERFTQVIVKKS